MKSVSTYLGPPVNVAGRIMCSPAVGVYGVPQMDILIGT